MFINSLYLLGIVIVLVIITETIMITVRKNLMMKKIQKAINEGNFEIEKVDEECDK